MVLQRAGVLHVVCCPAGARSRGRRRALPQLKEYEEAYGPDKPTAKLEKTERR
jgi:hypothetical protein